MHHTRKTTSSVALEELKRRDQLESLRSFLISEQCFPSSKDPETSPITLEELKKLVRIWKLNERRNFWKTHSERDDIVAALIQHAEQVFNYGANNNGGRKANGISGAESSSVSPLKPSLPSDPRPSSMGSNMKNFCGLKYFNRTVKPAELTIHSRFYTFPTPPDRVDNVVDRWRTEDFTMKDDFFSNGNGSGGNNNGNGVVNTRASVSISNSAEGVNNRQAAGLRNKVKLMKQRNLALHLMNYSAHVDFKKTSFTVKSVQTFINVAESDDTKTVSNCMIALSNISSDSQVRSVLLEINAMHKITNMLQFLRGRSAHWSAGLLFYYFSCDKESEDRVYNASSILLQANGNSKDPQTRLIALYTLNNLMPCIDRQRVAEFIMRILLNHFDPNIVFHDKHLTDIYLTIMQNMTWFTNAHSTLMNCSILELLEKFAQYAAKNKNGDVGLSVAKILLSFLQLPEQAVNLVTYEFLHVLTILISCDHEATLIHTLKAAVVLSTVSPMRKAIVRSSDLMKAVSDMLINKSVISNSLGRESAKFLSNMSLSIEESIKTERAAALVGPPSPDRSSAASPYQPITVMTKFVDDNVHEAIFSILRSVNSNVLIKSTAIHALQNIVAYAPNGLKLVSKCLDPMIRFLRDQADLGAIQVLYNLSCIAQCRSELVENKIHTKSLELMMMTREGTMKSAYLQILVQLSSSSVCILELLKMDLIAKLESQLKQHAIKCDVWKDISLMLLAIVAYAGESLTEKDHISIVRILKMTCSPAAMRQAVQAYIASLNSTNTSSMNTPSIGMMSNHMNSNNNNQSSKFDYNEFANRMTTTHLEEILENGANILKFISIQFDSFEEMDPVVRTIIEFGTDNEEIVENVSHVLYNMTCYERNINLMLNDATYLNVMIRLMRNGKVHIQENIAHAMRTLCSVPKCVELLVNFDILSDLIVIALLRTSSEEIKIICSEAFYNMLTHESTRLKLLQGDLWWALMRLGRTDSEAVRSICVRALADLATPFNPETIALDPKIEEGERGEIIIQKSRLQLGRIHALRGHHVLSFMKDLSTASNPDNLLQCLQVVHNILGQFAELPNSSIEAHSSYSAPKSPGMSSKNPALLALKQEALANNVASSKDQTNGASNSTYAAHEIIASIRIGADAFHRGTNLKVVRIATLLLLKCAQIKIDGVDSEFLNIDIAEILKSTKESWSQHPDCRLNISRLLYELSKSKIFTKSVMLSDLSPIMVSAFEADTTSLEVCENILAVLMQFTFSENIPPRDIISLPIWSMIVKEALSIDSVIVQRGTSPVTLSGGKKQSISVPSNLAGNANRRATSSSGSAMQSPPSSSNPNSANGRVRPSVYIRDIVNITNATMDLSEGGTKGATPSLFRVQGIALALLAHVIDAQLEQAYEVVSPSVIQGLLRPDFIDHPWTKNNILIVFHACSQNIHSIAPFLQEDTFHLLMRYVHTSIGTSRQDKAQEFGSAFLRNASLHTNYLSKLITIPHAAVNEFVKEIAEAFSNPAIAMDLSVFFYHISNHLATNDHYLNPKFVLEMINKVSSNPVVVDKEHDVININKYTISMILNKYSFTQGVDPSFIQNMFMYIQSNMAAFIPELMTEISFKNMSSEIRVPLANDFVNAKDSTLAHLMTFSGDELSWQPILHRDIKTQDTILLKFSNAHGTWYDKLESVDSLPITVFSKILKSFERVKEHMVSHSGTAATMGGAGSAIVEEGDEFDEEDEDALDESHASGMNNNMVDASLDDKFPDELVAGLQRSHDLEIALSKTRIIEELESEEREPNYSDTESEATEKSFRSHRSDRSKGNVSTNISTQGGGLDAGSVVSKSNGDNASVASKQSALENVSAANVSKKTDSTGGTSSGNANTAAVPISATTSARVVDGSSKTLSAQDKDDGSVGTKKSVVVSLKEEIEIARKESLHELEKASTTTSEVAKKQEEDDADFYKDDFTAKSEKSRASQGNKSISKGVTSVQGSNNNEDDNYSTQSFEQSSVPPR